jgi:hypothetical protein
MSSTDALMDIAKSDFDKTVNIADVIKKVIPYVAAVVKHMNLFVLRLATPM